MDRVMDASKEHDEKDSDYWRTWKCSHCGENYEVNLKTRTAMNEEGWCPNCVKKILEI